MYNLPIYRSISAISLVKVWFFRLIIISIIIIISTHINENPQGLTILMILFFVLLGLVSHVNIEVFPYKLVIIRNFAFDIIKKRKTIYFDKIKYIQYEESTTQTRDNLIRILTLSPKLLRNYIFIEIIDHNGKSEILKVFVSEKQLKKVFEVIQMNNLLKTNPISQ